jgi:glycosyltransferase involved in cell wall biosynthesis
LNLFDEWAASKLKSLSGEVVHAFSGSAEKTFLEAKRLGKFCVLERSCPHIAYQYSLLTEECNLLGYVTQFTNPSSSMYSRMIREYEIADKIVVPSSYTYNSFLASGVNKKKLVRIPLAAEKTISSKRRGVKKNQDELVFLAIGGNFVRKGFFYLLEAWNKVQAKNARLIIKGSIPDLFKMSLSKNVTVLESHLSPNELSNLYCSADVLCLPSIDEGFGMVVFEAMSAGLPVILSNNVGASDLIQNYNEGIVTQVRNIDDLSRAIQYFINNPSEINKMGKSAAKTASIYSLDQYRSEMINFYNSL